MGLPNHNAMGESDLNRGGRQVPIRLHLEYAPAAVLLAIMMWYRYGPLTAVLCVVGGIGLGVLVEARGRRRSSREKSSE